jgi:hypothetical protein
VYESSITLSVVLAYLGEVVLDCPISFSSRNLSIVEKNYMTIEREGLATVYALKNFRHYLLGSHFKMYTDHFSLIYLVKKQLLRGNICKWLLLFQEYDF